MGGSGNHKGALLGALVLTTLLEGSRFLKDLIPLFPEVRLAALRLMLMGLLPVGFMMGRPEGIWREERPTRRGAGAGKDGER